MNILDIVMFHAKNYELIISPHFVERLKLRQSNTVPDEKGLYNLMSTQKPIHFEGQNDDRFKLFYSIGSQYDLIVVISLKNSNPQEITLITVYPQEAKRRVNRDE